VRSEQVTSRDKLFFIKEINENTDWTQGLLGQNVVIHCAARAHVMNEEVADLLSAYRQVNVDGTLNLARQAADAGVKRFIYLSSIKVNGESTSGNVPFTEEGLVNSLDPYGVSKLEAEEGLKKIATETGMEVVLIRPPLVYGTGVKANFLNLLKLSNTGLPLPFGMVKNKRSMVYVENLVDFIVKCIDHPAAANKTFLISDNHDLSLSGLLKLIRNSLNKPSRLIPVPSFLFKLAGLIFRKQDVVDRLVGDLQVDTSKAMSLLDWKPPYTVEQGIQATVDSFLKDNKQD
jgi:nucleoside-diphosphate-sugar epimerase|tara:strand:- start:531 stop:1397 length:867 start_codon:yes stop_codon:yes gene_type:complete